MLGGLLGAKKTTPRRKLSYRVKPKPSRPRTLKKRDTFTKEERAVTLENFPSLFSINTKTGVVVTQKNSLSYAPVFACVDLIASILSIIPVTIYEERDGGKYPAKDHDQYNLIRKEPHTMYSRSQWMHMMGVHMLLWGRGISKILRNNLGRPIEYEIVMPWDVKIDIIKDPETGRLAKWYKIKGEYYPSEDIIDFTDVTIDGKGGVGRINTHKESIGLGMALRDYGNELIGSGGKMMGYVYGDKKMTPDAYKLLAEKFVNGYGADNSVGVLPHGWKYEPFKYPLPPASAEYIAGKNFSTEEICTLFRTHPFLIGMSKGVNNSVAGSLIRSWLSHTISPIVTMIELELDRKIFRPSEKATHYVKYNLWALDRADMEKTMNAIVQGVNNGIMNKDEGRAILDRNPIPGGLGEDFYQALNQAPLDVAKEYFIQNSSNE